MNEMKINIGILFLLISIAFIDEKDFKKYKNCLFFEKMTEVSENMRKENSVQLLIEIGKLDSDSAEGTVYTLTELGISQLEKVKKIPCKTGVALQVTDSTGNTYYLGYGELGYLEVIRKDSMDGELLYVPID